MQKKQLLAILVVHLVFSNIFVQLVQEADSKNCERFMKNLIDPLKVLLLDL